MEIIVHIQLAPIVLDQTVPSKDWQAMDIFVLDKTRDSLDVIAIKTFSL